MGMARSRGTSVRKPSVPRFTPRIGTSQRLQREAAWISVPSPPSTTSRSARAAMSFPGAEGTPATAASASTSAWCPCPASQRTISRARSAAASLARRGISPTVATARLYRIAGLHSRGMPARTGQTNDLFRAAAAKVPSLICWGRPGSGKTTLARVIAAATRAELVALSAVDSGIKDIREAVAQAERRLSEHRRRTLLFIDEIHRFNKAQQDALLPHGERGAVAVVRAHTQNPRLEVNSALLSRCRVFALRALEESDLKAVLERALTDKERGVQIGRASCRERV